MPRYNICVDITGFEEDTVEIRFEIEHRLIQHGYRDGAEVAHDVLFPLSDDLVKFLEEARKLVNIVNYVDDYEPFDQEDLSLFVDLPDERDY